MIEFFIRRALQMVLVLFSVSFVVFSMNHFGGRDPVFSMVDMNSTQAEIDAMREVMGLDQPMLVQYRRYVGSVLQGNLGTSWRQAVPVLELILQRLPATLELAIFGMILSLLLGIVSGVLAAVRPKSLLSRSTMAVSILGISIPPFWLGIMLILTFSVSLGILPSSGRGEVATLLGVEFGFLTWDGLRHLILPALSMSVFTSAVIMRLQRATLREELTSDYVRFARAKGISERRVVLAHAFRNSLIPVTTYSGLHFVGTIGFAVITETIFAWPGLGKLLIDSINVDDRPVVIGYLLIMAALFSVVNLLTDLTYAVLDPRIRVG